MSEGTRVVRGGGGSDPLTSTGQDSTQLVRIVTTAGVDLPRACPKASPSQGAEEEEGSDQEPGSGEEDEEEEEEESEGEGEEGEKSHFRPLGSDTTDDGNIRYVAVLGLSCSNILYLHVRVRAYIHTCIHACTHAYMYACIHTSYIRTYVCIYIHIFIRT